MRQLRMFLREEAGLVAPIVAVFLALPLAAGVLQLIELVSK
ncbi:hypothetical protein [Lentzea guizhouensis]|nr:hypothetical protein [Lentzea guizhouensis]